MAVGHLAEGTLRAYADGELAAARRATVDRHLAGCAGCRERLAAVKADLQWAAAALGSPATGADVGTAPVGTGAALGGGAAEGAAVGGQPAVGAPGTGPVGTGAALGGGVTGGAAALGGQPAVGGPGTVPVGTSAAWRRVAAMAQPASGRQAPPRQRRRWAAGVAAAALVVGAAAVPQVRAAAGDVLQVFRVRRVQVVTLNASDLAQIRSALAGGQAGVDIRGIASVQVVPPQAPPVPTSLAAARRAVGFALTAPAGYTLSSATLRPGRVVRLTLHAAGINRLLAGLGSTARVPASLDGKLVTLTIPPSVRLAYSGFSVLETATPELAVPQGLDAAGLRQALLDLPFLPADVRAQMAAIQDWRDTVVLPEVTGVSQAVSVGGAQGVFVRAGSPGGSSALVWLSGSVVRAVTGHVTLAQAQAVAAAMR